MFKWLKKLAANKISVNITIHTPPPIGVVSTKRPREELISKPTYIRKSNFRFVSDLTTEYNGEKREYHYTEQYRDGSWHFLSDTGAGTKEKAMMLHLELLEKGTLEPTKKKVIHWEGLDKEETKVWVALQATTKE